MKILLDKFTLLTPSNATVLEMDNIANLKNLATGSIAAAKICCNIENCVTEIKRILKPGATIVVYSVEKKIREKIFVALQQHGFLWVVKYKEAILARLEIKKEVFVSINVQGAIIWGELLLKELGNERMESEILLAHVLGFCREKLISQFTRSLCYKEEVLFCKLLKQRLKREPLAYIIGNWGFMSLEFQVGADVLVPRPETEFLVEFVVDYFKNRPFVGVDLGTGSGCIAISILKYLPQAHMLAGDISFAALKVAQKNAQVHQVMERLLLFQGDLLEPTGGKLDLIVSNPPYIPQREYSGLMPEVKYEPKTALVAQQDGLLFYRRILQQAEKYLNPGGIVALELGYGQLPQVQALLSDNLSIIQIIPDYAGIERVLVLEVRKSL